MSVSDPSPGPRPGAGTTVAGVIGDPVRHSLSPALHRAAYAALGLDQIYLTFEVPSGAFPEAVRGAGALGFRGLSVTMPHKDAAAAVATRRSATVRKLASANTLTFSGREIVADSTDGVGLLDDLREWAGFDPEGRRCGVIGAGGAARAVILALAEAGAAQVLVVNRTPSRAFRAAAVAPKQGSVARPEQLAGLDLVVQATSLGMLGDTTTPDVDPRRFGSGQLIVDLIYRPAVSRFLEAASSSGARTRNGLGMLVHQAAHQIEIWTGTRPPLEVMWQALDANEA